jgi:hypothetical protein
MSGSEITSSQESEAKEAERALLANIYDRLKAMNANRVCPICSNNDWWYLDSSFRRTKLSILSGMGVILTYSLACTRCGYVQSFLSDVLDGKVLPPGEGEDGRR